MTAVNDESKIYKEEQGFDSGWLRAIVLGISALLVVLAVWGFYQQIVLGQPWGSRPASNLWLIVICVAMILFAIVLAYFFLRAHLVISVDREAVHISLAPFGGRDVPLSKIDKAEPRIVRPWREFGGVGMRWTPNGYGYLVGGNQGVQLVLTDGKRIFVGSQHPKELAAAINSAREGHV